MTFRRIWFGPAAGASMPIDMRSQKRMLLGIYERELWPAYARLLRGGMGAFDIGGRDGYTALLINKQTRGPVISFECDAGATSDMAIVFAKNTAQVRAVQAFVGKADDPQTTLTLDRAAERYFMPDFIKIDVEGAESSVLLGGEKVLDRHPGMIIEVHGEDQERLCIDILKMRRYEIEIINQARFFREQRPLAHNRWLICT